MMRLRKPYVNQGRIRFTKRHHLLLDQLRVFPLGVHDDGPDALEMACQEALVPRIRVTVRQF